MEKTKVEMLIERIVDKYGKAFRLNDDAHQIDHFHNVFTTGLYINDKLSLGHKPEKIAAVAYFHDMFSWSRYNHHQMSAHWVRTTDCPIIKEFSIEDRWDISVGCGEHRASFKGEFTCEFSELMNSADREMPDVTGMRILSRSVRCSLSSADNYDETLKRALEHIHEKFGSSGYARYPAMYEQAFSDVLQEQRKTIDALTFDKAFELLKNPHAIN